MAAGEGWIPARWKRFELTRVFRNTTYRITVKNPEGVQHGVKELWVNGRREPGTLIPHKRGRKEVTVLVIMGEA